MREIRAHSSIVDGESGFVDGGSGAVRVEMATGIGFYGVAGIYGRSERNLLTAAGC